MFLGANDGFPMSTPSGATADCCGSAWVKEYARRARQMMGSYARGGRGRVYWLLLPAARGGPYRADLSKGRPGAAPGGVARARRRAA